METPSSQNQILNYINYYILESDLQRFFTPYKYTLIFWVEVIAIFSSLLIFYLPILLQVFGYYFLGPSLTPANIETMNAERELLNQYVNLKSKYKLECTGMNTLGIKDLTTNTVMEALTLTGQVITNCSSLNL